MNWYKLLKYNYNSIFHTRKISEKIEKHYKTSKY